MFTIVARQYDIITCLWSHSPAKIRLKIIVHLQVHEAERPSLKIQQIPKITSNKTTATTTVISRKFACLMRALRNLDLQNAPNQRGVSYSLWFRSQIIAVCGFRFYVVRGITGNFEKSLKECGVWFCLGLGSTAVLSILLR